MQRGLLRTLLVLSCGLLPVVAAAQARATGQIVGTVKDASGAVLPNAALVLIDSGTGTSFEAKSGPDRNFTFPNLQPGTYSLTATATGFQPATLQDIVIQTATDGVGARRSALGALRLRQIVIQPTARRHPPEDLPTRPQRDPLSNPARG
jgi:hypothetical protein